MRKNNLRFCVVTSAKNTRQITKNQISVADSLKADKYGISMMKKTDVFDRYITPIIYHNIF